MLNRLHRWIRANVLRRRLEREMREEMTVHLESSTSRLMARGLTREEAELQARREFGNVTYLQEEGRYARGTVWLDAVVADAQFALRHFIRRPLTTLVMFVVLAVGMSISTLLFSYVHSYAVSPPAGVTPTEDVVRIRGSRDAGSYGRVFRTFPEDEFRDYRALTSHFAEVAGWSDAGAALDAGADVELRGLESRVAFVTENYFRVLGVQPLLGPGLPAEAAGADGEAVAVINHRAWEELFESSPDVIGRTIALNGVPLTIVGVAPETFQGITSFGRFKVFVPVSARELVVPQSPPEFRAVGVLQEGVSRSEAAAAVEVIALRMSPQTSNENVAEPSADVVPLLSANGDPMFDRDVRLMIITVGLLGLLVLLVTCTNVSALLTGLATARRQEIAVRLSLGAARTRIIRQLLTETAVLAILSAGAALGIVWLVLDTAMRFFSEMPFDMRVRLPAVLFTFGVALGAGVLFGLSPALHATRMGVASALRDSAGLVAATRARLQRGLVVAQIAFTQPLIVLFAAVLMLVLGGLVPAVRSWSAERVMLVQVHNVSAPPADEAAAAAAVERHRLMMHELRAELNEMPGVEAVAFDSPNIEEIGAYAVRDGGIEHTLELSAQQAETGFFDVMDIPVLRGRAFNEDDVAAANAGSSPIILSSELARRLWGSEDPIGRELHAQSDSTAGPRRLVVVGMIDDPEAQMRNSARDLRVYVPLPADAAPRAVLVRTAGAALTLLPEVRGLAQTKAPNNVTMVRTLEDIERNNRRRVRIVTGSLLGAGAVALLLSAIGLYAVVSFAVGQRTGEIAVRMAVGAGGRQIMRKFVSDGLKLSIFGLILGLPASILGLKSLMTDPDLPVVPLGPVTMLAAAGVLIVATLAVWIPALRAARVDPMVTLRRQ